MIRIHLFLFAILIGNVALVASAEPSFEKEIQPLLQRYCLKCHNAKKQEADLRLDTLSGDFSVGDAAETWHDVLNKINLGEMPPDEAEQPSAKELSRIVELITLRLKEHATSKQGDTSQVVLRRLTRCEYNNTLRDLLGVDFDFAADLPPEPTSPEGFRNSGSTLGMSPLQLELYLQAARLALGKAIVQGEEPKVHRHVITKSNGKKRKKDATPPNHLAPGDNFVARILEFPREGEIIVRVKAGADTKEGVNFPRMRITFGLRSDVLTAEEPFAEVDVRASADDPQVVEFRKRIESFPLPGHNPKYPGVMITVWNGGENAGRNNKAKKPKKGEAGESSEGVATIFVESVEFVGPVFETWPPQSHTRILPPRKDETEVNYVRRVINAFASRAFRRPITESELDRFVKFHETNQSQWPTFEDAIRETLAMVLISPEFLYLVEPTSNDQPARKLNDYEIATRLSYFLWSSMPDDQLTQLASNGELRDPKVLRKQIEAMLADPKSSEFVKHFTNQWLNLSGIERVAVNPEYYPNFNNDLKVDMQRETQAFFAEILHNDHSALNLLDSDFAMLNQPLASHYEIPGPRGHDFEMVQLKADYRRGGLLSQAGILLANSNGEDSHPIRRAVWVLDRLLGSPPAPPPPDVPELNSNEPDLAGLPLKEQLELHRQKQSCNNCHKNIDPWGIAFENYDAIGKWRTETIRNAKKGRGKQSPVVAVATLPGGHEVNGLNELKSHLLKHEHKRFSKTLVKKLLTYSIGRSLDFTDEETVDQIHEKFAASDYSIKSLIVAIVSSKAFQTK